jgi:hypothetical protein
MHLVEGFNVQIIEVGQGCCDLFRGWVTLLLNRLTWGKSERDWVKTRKRHLKIEAN